MFMSVAKQICEPVPHISVNYLYDIHKLILKHVIIFSSVKHFTFLVKIYYVNLKNFGYIILHAVLCGSLTFKNLASYI
jgi:hypothetical protein